MANKQQGGSIKRTLITKANKRILIASGAAAFVVVFSLVASNILIKQMSYQNRVISERKKQLKIAKDSLDNVETLQAAYLVFDRAPLNILGGVPDGEGDKDGANSKIILDALPSVYNFPALTTSIEKIVELQGLEFISMVGTDDAVTQQQNASSSSPVPIEMPFEFSVKGTYESSLNLVKDLERSIRPFQIVSITISAEGEDGSVNTRITGKTYFQPEKNLNLIKEKVQ
jgi:hypothetical protein